MPWPKTGTSHYHAKLELPDKSRAIKLLVVYNSWNVSALGIKPDVSPLKQNTGGRSHWKSTNGVGYINTAK